MKTNDEVVPDTPPTTDENSNDREIKNHVLSLSLSLSKEFNEKNDKGKKFKNTSDTTQVNKIINRVTTTLVSLKYPVENQNCRVDNLSQRTIPVAIVAVINNKRITAPLHFNSVLLKIPIF